MSENLPIVVGITGASGAPYARRLLEVLLASGRRVHLAVSGTGAEVWRQELGWELPLEEDWDPARLKLADSVDLGLLEYYPPQDFSAPMVSGSALNGGRVVCPCSGDTLSAIAHGGAGNVIRRAAEVQLKERRKLVLMTRETPLSLAAIENMRQVTLAGAVVLPAAPGWYHSVNRLGDLVDFIVARIMQQLEIPCGLVPAWGAAARPFEFQREER